MQNKAYNIFVEHVWRSEMGSPTLYAIHKVLPSFAILLLANFQKTFYREDYRLLERNKKSALPAKQKALNFFTN